MSKETLIQIVAETKTWSELDAEVNRQADRQRRDIFENKIINLVDFFVAGASKEATMHKAEALFDREEVLQEARVKLGFLLTSSKVEEEKSKRLEELSAQQEWKEEKEALLCTATGIENGHYYWEFNSLEEAWDFRSTLVKLKQKEKLIGGGRDGFYTDMKSKSTLRFTVVKLA